MIQIDNLILEKCLGKGSFGEVHLTRIEGDNKLYATKIYDRAKIENTDAFKYLSNEINILNNLKHPNIVKFVQVKKNEKSLLYSNGILQRRRTRKSFGEISNKIRKSIFGGNSSIFNETNNKCF